MLVGVRTLVDPNDPADMKQVHALQDALKVEQKAPGKFEVPKWDPVSQKKVREALIVLGTTLTDTGRAFGLKIEVDPSNSSFRRPRPGAATRERTPSISTLPRPRTTATTIYKLNVKDVPVDGFWSISLYNADGYFQKNDLNAYSLNNITSKKNADGSVAIQFGGCDGKIPNCLPIMNGWNYTVRLYRPRAEILSWQVEVPGGAAGELSDECPVSAVISGHFALPRPRPLLPPKADIARAFMSIRPNTLGIERLLGASTPSQARSNCILAFLLSPSLSPGLGENRHGHHHERRP